MEKSKKFMVAGGVVLGLCGIIYTFTRKPDEPGAGASISIEILDSEGNLVHSPSAFGTAVASSPVPLVEGQSYTIKLNVTNQSTKAGTPWAASLKVFVSAGTDFHTFIAPQTMANGFAAGETKVLTVSMPIPLGSGGEVGSISAAVYTPGDVLLGQDNKSVSITEVPIIYGATIGIGI